MKVESGKSSEKQAGSLPTHGKNRLIRPVFFVLLGMAVSSLVGRAQDEADASAKPSPPYLATLKGDFTFTKKYTHKDRPQDANLTQEQRDVQKFLTRFPIVAAMASVESGTLRMDKQTFTNGLSIEIWRVGNYRLSVYSSSPDYVTVGTAATPATENSPASPGLADVPDFQELSWINAGAYQGVQNWQGRQCYVYKSGDQTAWVEKSSRLPVFYESSSLQITYAYGTPDEPLTIPAKFAKRLQGLTQH